MIHLKSTREIELMRRSGKITAQILKEVAEAVRPGVTTLELDQLAERRCKELGATPAFKGYNGFPGCLCVSVNDQVVHGIPSAKKVLKDGDIVGVDFGVVIDGYYGDSAVTVGVGK